MPDKFKGFVTSNMGAKFVSVIIAIVLWVGVLISRNVEVTKEVPLEIVTANDVLPANEIPEKIAFRLSGPKAFLRTILDRREDPIRVNLANVKPGLVTYRFFSDNIRVPIGVKVLSINPTAILIKLENLKRKEIPVRVELRGAPADGYRVVKTEVRPSTVRIRGAETRIESLNEVSTIPIDISNTQQNIDREAPLDLSRYSVQLESPLPRVVVNVEPIAANYRIRNVELRVLASHKVKLKEDKSVTVLVRASPKDLKSLDRGKVYAVVDLRGRPKGDFSEPVKVNLPESIGLVKVIPEKIKVTLY